MSKKYYDSTNKTKTLLQCALILRHNLKYRAKHKIYQRDR